MLGGVRYVGRMNSTEDEPQTLQDFQADAPGQQNCKNGQRIGCPQMRLSARALLLKCSPNAMKLCIRSSMKKHRIVGFILRVSNNTGGQGAGAVATADCALQV